MSRRRQPKTPVSVAPNDGTPFGHLSDADMLREMARRRLGKGGVDLAAIEDLVEQVQRHMGEETLAAALAALGPEDGKSKPCPRCGRLTPVKARNRPRHILTVAGELRFTRYYHHCKCGTGFYPRDAELKLPEEGEVSPAMERRILDFGINDTFESVAERWSIHYPTSISANLVRRVMDRVGLRCEAASDERLQQACREEPEQPASMLVVATDGSMLLTREAAWKEVKVAVVASAEAFQSEKQRRRVDEARYVAVLGGQEAFKKSLAAALAAERADEVPLIAWVGDGARENWTLASDLCPFATQILAIPHIAKQPPIDGVRPVACATNFAAEQAPAHSEIRGIKSNRAGNRITAPVGGHFQGAEKKMSNFRTIAVLVSILTLAGCVHVNLPEHMVSDTVDAGKNLVQSIAGKSERIDELKQNGSTYSLAQLGSPEITIGELKRTCLNQLVSRTKAKRVVDELNYTVVGETIDTTRDSAVIVKCQISVKS